MFPVLLLITCHSGLFIVSAASSFLSPEIPVYRGPNGGYLIIQSIVQLIKRSVKTFSVQQLLFALLYYVYFLIETKVHLYKAIEQVFYRLSLLQISFKQKIG